MHLYYTNEPFLRANAALIKRLARLADVKEVEDGKGLHLTQTKYRCWLDIDAETAAHYRKELETKKSGLEARIRGLEARLDNKSYTQNAPHEVVAETKDQLEEAKDLLQSIMQEHQRFSS